MNRATQLLAVFALLFIGFAPNALNAADKGLGKLFIKAADSTVNGQVFADPELADSIKDMKSRHGKFAIVDDESQADFLIVVLERKSEMRSPMGTPVNYKMIAATLSVRDGSSWKPVCKLANSGFNGGASWGVAAGSVMKEAEKSAAGLAGK